MLERFHDRKEAGGYLAQLLCQYAFDSNVIILALPRGGVPVAAEVAHLLRAPLDVHLVRKLGMPGHEEFAFGALAENGIRVLHEEVVELAHLSDEAIDAVTRHELGEMSRRQFVYRGDRPPPSVQGATVILIDDGLATGATMQAAILSIRRQHPARVVVAVPVGAAETCRQMEQFADEVVCARKPSPFYAVGLWYDEFEQISDDAVIHLLAQSSGPASPMAVPPPG